MSGQSAAAAIRRVRLLVAANARQVTALHRFKGELESKQDMEGVWNALLSAINAHDPSPHLAAQLQPLVASTKKHYRGYTDDDYTDILVRSQFGADASCRGGAEERREDAASIGKCSPCKSNFYARVLEARTETDLRAQGRDLAFIQVAAYAYFTGHARVRLVLDERDESSSSASPLRNKTTTTEGGRRLRWRKRAMKLRAAMREKGLRYQEFRDSDMLGHEYMALAALFEDGTRLGIEGYASGAFQTLPASFLEEIQSIQARLADLGIQTLEVLLDRRWSGTSSLKLLLESKGNFIVRLSNSADRRQDTKSGNKRHARKEAGELAWNHEELACKLWETAKAVAGKNNVLVASLKAEPFQGFGDKLTIVVGYAPQRGYKFRDGEQLEYRKNMFPIFFSTNRPATHAWAEYTYNTYLDERWGIETDIKEGKSYEQLGSGPDFRTKMLTVQASMLMQNFATILWRCSELRRWRRKFMRWTFNSLLRAYTAFEAVVGGWAWQTDAGPP